MTGVLVAPVYYLLTILLRQYSSRQHTGTFEGGCHGVQDFVLYEVRGAVKISFRFLSFTGKLIDLIPYQLFQIIYTVGAPCSRDNLGSF